VSLTNNLTGLVIHDGSFVGTGGGLSLTWPSREGSDYWIVEPLQEFTAIHLINATITLDNLTLTGNAPTSDGTYLHTYVGYSWELFWDNSTSTEPVRIHF